jgi:hypothetical protein
MQLSIIRNRYIWRWRDAYSERTDLFTNDKDDDLLTRSLPPDCHEAVLLPVPKHLADEAERLVARLVEQDA